jgi:hypothetical protein
MDAYIYQLDHSEVSMLICLNPKSRKYIKYVEKLAHQFYTFIILQKTKHVFLSCLGFEGCVCVCVCVCARTSVCLCECVFVLALVWSAL